MRSDMHPIAQAFACEQEKTNVIAHLMPSDLEGMNYSSGYVASIAAALRETQYNLILAPFFPDQDPMRAVKTLYETVARMRSL